MELVGKCAPSPESLRAAADRGFDAVELYLTPEHIDDVTAVRTAVEGASVRVATVHTPHVRPDDRSLDRVDDLAETLDAYLVVHSQYAQHTHIPELERHGFRAAYGYENNPGASRYHLENLVLDRGHDLVLDTAHLYTAEAAYLDALEALLTGYGEQISVVHLNDATAVEDGLAIGASEVDLRETTRLLDHLFEGTVVLEVMPAEQASALDAARNWLD
jgi:sugar phosphate isomerase/epimerase